MLSTAIADFGQRLGMNALSLNADGMLALDIAGLGKLYLEEHPTDNAVELLIYLLAPRQTVDWDLPRRALAECHYAHAYAWPVWTGIYKDQLMVLTRLPERKVTGQTLENVARFLNDRLNNICQGN